MVEAIKMAARVVAVGAICVLMVAVFAAMASIITVPAALGSDLLKGIGIARAFMDTWTNGAAGTLLGIAGGIIVLELALIAIRVAKIVQNAIFKVSEG